MGLFGGKSGGSAGSEPSRSSRHSSGWLQLGKHLRQGESLRLLDIGPTSAGNINFVTGLGHSIYMANLVEDAARPEWARPADEEPAFDTGGYLKQNLDFAGRHFDVVTLWDTLDFLPAPFAQPVVDRLYEVMEPGGQLLAFFHSKPTGDQTVFTRYHLTDSDQVELQNVGGRPMLMTYSNRQVEQMFHRFAGWKFFLAKDALREVIVTR